MSRFGLSAVNDVVKAVVAGERRIVVVDVEATCWKKGVFSRKKKRSKSAPCCCSPIVPNRNGRSFRRSSDRCGFLASPASVASSPVSLDVKKLAARIVGSKSFEGTARELAPDSAALPRHRAIADARRTAQILYGLLRPLG